MNVMIMLFVTAVLYWFFFVRRPPCCKDEGKQIVKNCGWYADQTSVAATHFYVTRVCACCKTDSTKRYTTCHPDIQKEYQRAEQVYLKWEREGRLERMLWQVCRGCYR